MKEAMKIRKIVSVAFKEITDCDMSRLRKGVITMFNVGMELSTASTGMNHFE